MKKISFCTLIFLLVGVFSMGHAFANEQNEEERKYAKIAGEVVEIEKDGEGLRMVVEDDKELQTIFPLPDEGGIFTNSGKPISPQDLEKGMKIEAYYDQTVARIMIYPMVIIPELVIVQTEDEAGTVMVEKFDENLLSYKGDIRLSITDETELMDLNGNNVSEAALADQELAIFYTVVLESYPAQIRPEKVVLLGKEEAPAETSMFFKVHGTVTAMEETDEFLRVSIEDELELPNILLISDDSTLLYKNAGVKMDKQEIKVGMKIEAFYDKTKPQILIYPPTFSPEIAIVHLDEEPGFVKVGHFDENLVSLDGELKLQIAEDTKLLNQAGETIAVGDLANRELLVFYTTATKSIPAQTTPEMVIALDVKVELEPVEEMVPLRQTAEELGYEVIWHQNTKTVVITNPSLMVQLSIGEAEYTVNGRTFTFEVVPELENGKTYVSNKILKSLNP